MSEAKIYMPPIGAIDENDPLAVKAKSAQESAFSNDASSLREFNPPLVTRGSQASEYWNLSDLNPYSSFFDKVRSEANYQSVWELAMQYDANQRALAEQREYDKSVLDEQREYELPSAQMARQRQAGINPDIQGSSGSSASSGSDANIIGSSGTATLPTSDSFRDVYKEKELSLQKWNTAANVINSLSGVASTIIGGISVFRKLPAELDVASAQAESLRAGASLSNAQATEITSLLDGKIDSQKINNIIDKFGFVSELYKYATNDSDINSILGGIGFSDDEIPHINNVFSELKKNPNFSANSIEGGIRLRKANVDNVAFSTDYLSRLVSKTNELNELNLDGDILQARLTNSIKKVLSNSSYADNTAESLIVGSENQLESARLAQQQLKTDAESYVDYLYYRASEISSSKTRLQELKDKLNSKGLSESERHEMDYLEDIIPVMMSSGSNALDSFKAIGRQITRNSWLTDAVPGMNLNRDDPSIQAMEIHFGQIVENAVTKNDVVRTWLQPVTTALSALGIGLGMKRTSSTTTTRSTNLYGPNGSPTSWTDTKVVF